MNSSNQRHGLTLGIERTGSTFFFSFRASGTLTHEDYQKITPVIDASLEGIKDPHINCLADLTQLQGWELRAGWDDLKIGLKHGGKFERVAILGNKHWEEVGAKVASWVMSTEVKYFEEEGEALDWLLG